ncbi:discoidin domain-containing protein [Clostridium swellfunianum]|uniref:RHS repeat domain-containing protein n=1 Tax=Clostridium swellfunianum TaxID=1367462 RepID=UPI00202E34D4|nr:discoidin domain-containing protein [Clostridium swellfunianum]
MLGNRSFKINGNAYTRKNVFQVVNTPGKKGDIFVVGGWAKGESIPDADLGRLGIIIGFKLPNLDAYEWHGFDFNRGSTDWQYLSDRIITQNDYTHIEFYYTYYTNVNKAYFDGAQLYKEEFGASYQYDDKGNLKSTADLSKQTSNLEYSTANDLVKSTDPQGSSFTYAYDSKHNATKATSAQNVVYSFEYDSFGNPKTSKVGEGMEYIQSTAEYTSSGNYIKSLTDSSGNTVSYNYNEAKGTLDSFADANGKLITYGYDNVDRLTSVSKDVQGKSITNSYSYENDRIKGITHNGFSYNFGYDSLGSNTSVSVGSQSLITNSYEARTGKLLESTYGNGQKVSSDYDSQDRVTAKKFNGIVRYKYAYDASGNLGYHEDIVNNAAYKYSYDLADRLTRIKDSSNNSTDFSYDLNNNLSKITERFGDFNYTNISLNKPATASSSENASTAPSNAVDNNNGTRWSSQSSDPQWIYVDLGEIKNIRRVVLNWETAYGKSYQIQVSNDASNWTTVYSTNSSDGGIDEINNLSSSGRYVRMYGTQRATSWGYSLWSFDVYDDNSIVTQYEYDKDNKPSKVILNNNKQLSYQYDSIARLKNKTISTDTPYTTSFSYMAGINGSTTNKIEAINNNGKSISYSYDKNGNIKTITDAGRQILYYYNELNELIQEDNQVLNKTIIYSYDDGGNITSKLEIPYGAGAVRKTINYAYDSVWKDKLASYDGKPITYDAIGNPLTYDGWSFEWEEGRQLKSMSWKNHVISYKYNDAGTRTEMTVDGLTTKYHLVGDKVSFEENGTDRIYYSYDSSDNLISMNLNGADYYYTRNAQGDIIGLLDKSGAQVVSYTYDSWGKLISIDGSLKDTVGKKNPYRYRGYRYDTETGLYYLNSRYYNPDWGRFLNADALGGKVGELLSHNVFAYCKNNPINMYDPSGYWSIKNFLQNAWDTIVNKTLATVATIHAGVLTWAKLSVNPDTAPVLEAVGIPTITTVATRSLSKISTKKGGAYSKVSKNGGENHHMPAQSVSPFSKGKGPAINMSKADHRLTASWGNSKEAQLYRANQADLISQGMFKQAQQMDIDNVRGLFGNKYDEGIKQMVDYTITLFKD